MTLVLWHKVNAKHVLLVAIVQLGHQIHFMMPMYVQEEVIAQLALVVPPTVMLAFTLKKQVPLVRNFVK